MTIQIAPLAALLLAVGIAVGITVFRYTARAQGAGGRGDLGAAIASGVTVAMLLATLLTPGFGEPPAAPATSTNAPRAVTPAP
ncbi:hypothetical protein [Streptomyces sp. NPDC001930]|uniref:hypothetical protein n=1 Tax=Streptomyces sp. NPDC001930 TaxID=3364625 RepID=UPI0036CA8B9E